MSSEIQKPSSVPERIAIDKSLIATEDDVTALTHIGNRIKTVASLNTVARLKAFFATKKVKRLANYRSKIAIDLSSPSQETDEANYGYLYMFDDNEKEYRRLKKGELDVIFTSEELEELYNDPESGLKRSDFFGTPSFYFPYYFTDLSKYKAGEENNQWLMPSEGVKKVYAFAKGEQIHPITKKPFAIESEDTFFQVNKDESILIKKDGTTYLINLDGSEATKEALSTRCLMALHELEKEREDAARVNDVARIKEVDKAIADFNEGISQLAVESIKPNTISANFLGLKPSLESSNMNTAITLLRLAQWFPAVHFPRFPKEDTRDYEQRIAQYEQPSELWRWQRELYDYTAFSLADISIPLKRQLLFFSYYKNTTEENRQKIHKILKHYYQKPEKAASFFEAFTLCEYDSTLGDQIVEIAKEKPNEAENIFQYLKDITDIAIRIWERKLDDVIDLLGIDRKKPGLMDTFATVMENVDFQQLYAIFLKKGKDFLGKALKGNLAVITEEQKQIELRKITIGACMSGFIQKKGQNIHAIIANIERVFPDISINITGGEAGQKPTRPLMFLKDGIWQYPYNNLWNAKYLQTLEHWIDQSYAKEAEEIDAGWAEHLKEKIPFNIANEDVQKIMITYQNDLIATFFVHPTEEEGVYYCGTMYVDDKWQKDYDIGYFMQKIGFSAIVGWRKIIGSVAIANTALERHINANGAVGIGLFTEGNSKELVRVEWNHQIYVTKNLENYPESLIKEIAKGNQSLEGQPNAENIAICKLNSAVNENQEFINTLRKNFDEGYVVTRIFYHRTQNGKPDPRQTYVVFEKPV